MKHWFFLLALVGCYKDPHFGDCEIACTETCPGDLTCLAGACRAPGMTGACTVHPGGDANSGGEPIVDHDAPGPDTDGDTIPDSIDNCPTMANKDQANEDGDDYGDACDPCPISNDPLADKDSDMDGVGDGCDPHPNQIGDAIDVFEGFNSSVKPTAATEFGPGTWTYDAVAGTAHVDAPVSADSKLVWPINGTNGTTTTLASMQATGMPASVGTTDLTNAPTGVACENIASSGASTSLDLTSGGSTIPAASSSFTQGMPYVIALTRTSTTSWICKRGDGATISGQLNASGFNRGIVAKSAGATFDYVMIVTSP